jgi:glycosyltransferase involved in cell wall biosynthesis
MALPYKVITNSGSAILALSHHVPLVIPDVATLKEYIPDGCAEYFDKDNPASLRGAMRAIQNMDKDEYEKERAKQIKELSWDHIAEQTISAYESTFPLVAREKEGKTVKS